MGLLDFILGRKKRRHFKPIPSDDPVVEARQAIYYRKLPEDLSDYTICLTDYENQATLDIFKPENKRSIQFHRAYLKAYAREVGKRGGVAKIYKVYMQDYLNWLRNHQLKNSPENLEHFVEHLHQKG